MKLSNKTSRIIAFLLLLVFLQKMGPRLYLHNCYHIKTNQSSIPSDNKTFNTSCDCIEDFCTAFIESSTVIHIVVPVQYIEYPFIVNTPVCTIAKTYSSLRGPPSIMQYYCLVQVCFYLQVHSLLRNNEPASYYFKKVINENILLIINSYRAFIYQYSIICTAKCFERTYFG